MIYEAIFLLTCAIVFFRFGYLLIKGRAWAGTVSTITTVLYILCLFVPANLQSDGLVQSKLVRAGILGAPSADEIFELSQAWSIEVFTILAAETLAYLVFLNIFRGQIRTAKLHSAHLEESDIRRRANARRVALYTTMSLILFGLIAALLFPAGAIEDRGTAEGAGIFVLLRTSLVVGLAIMAFHNFFGKTTFFIVEVLGIVAIVLSGVRSPLIVILLGYAAGVIARNELKLPRFLLFLTLGALLMVAGSFMSSYRGAIIRGQSPDASTVLYETLENPFIAAYGSGIDTLDGYRLAIKVQPGEPADPANLIVAFTTIIPQSVWPDKPRDLSLGITSRYLKWKAGTIFLSLVGYLRIALGGYIAALCMTALIFFGVSLSYIRNYKNIVAVFLLTLVFRLGISGSPFDFHYTLVLILLYLSFSTPWRLIYKK